jgi:hypothetical protein
MRHVVWISICAWVKNPFGESCRDPVMDVDGSRSGSEKQVSQGGVQLLVGGVSMFRVVSWIGCNVLRPWINPICLYLPVLQTGVCEKLIGTCGAIHPYKDKKLFEKPCPRLWTTMWRISNHRQPERETKTLTTIAGITFGGWSLQHGVLRWFGG